MKAPNDPGPDATQPSALGEADSAVVVLQHLEEQRGSLFTEVEYQEMRQAVLEELAFGMRLRPFTFFTFATVGLGLAALGVVGLVTSPGRRLADYALALLSGVALLCVGGFYGSLLTGVEKDRLRTLDERLAELEELRKLSLVNQTEYQDLRSHILQLRQHSKSARNTERVPSRSRHR